MEKKRQWAGSKEEEETVPSKIKRTEKVIGGKLASAKKLTKAKNLKSGFKKSKLNIKQKSENSQSVVDQKSEKLVKTFIKKSEKSGKTFIKNRENLGKSVVKTSENTLEKPNWNEFKKKKKELRQKRREQKCSFFDNTCKAKKLWEKMRRTDCKSEERDSLAHDIHRLLQNTLQKIVFSHDLSRIVQWLLKLGPSDVKQEVVKELTTFVPNMLESKYARFCVKSMLKHGNATSKRAIVHSLRGKAVKLAGHSVAAPVLETIYSKWATAAERNLMQQEFFGDLCEQDNQSNIEDIMASSPAIKGAMLSAAKANLIHILDKKLAKSSLVHTMALLLLRHCSKEDQDEICHQIQECLLDFTSTKNGSFAAILCVSRASNKAKKSIMKMLKGHLVEIAKLEFGHLVILALFDTVDDTVLLKKILMPELLCDLWNLVNNEYGKKVILYLVAHRDPLYFHPYEIAILSEGVSLSNSKKDMAVRIEEIRDSVLTPLLEAIASDTSSWMSSSSIEMVTLAVLKAGEGEVARRAFESVVKYVCDPDGKIGELMIPEHPGTHMMLKKLILHDNNKHVQGHGDGTFTSVLASELSPDVISSWVQCNRACFILVLLLESKLDSVAEEVLRKLQGFEKEIKSQTSPASKVLQKKMTVVQK